MVIPRCTLPSPCTTFGLGLGDDVRERIAADLGAFADLVEEVGLGGGRLPPGEADRRRKPGRTGWRAGVGSGTTSGVSEDELE